MFLLDTNVLVYAANPASREHPPCARLLQEARDGLAPWYVTWGILYELLRVATHPRVFPRPMAIKQGWAFVDIMLTSPQLKVLIETDRHPEVAAQIFREVPLLRGNLLHDAHTAILMREHGIRRIYTRDMDFHRFPFLEVIDPLAGLGNPL